MKAPDKIYLAESDNIRGEVTSNFASSTPFRKHDSIAYIRKDALLEWAKETKAEIKDRDCIEEDIRYGAIWELEEVIAKIESL